MKTMGMTVYRLTHEMSAASLNEIVATAQRFRADGSGLKLYVTIDVSTQDVGSGVTFTSEALARAYGFTSGQQCAQALAPYADVIIGMSCGNEMTRKDSMMPNSVVMGTNPSDFSNAKWPIFRGVQAGVYAGIKSVTTLIPVFSNAWTFAEIAAPQMLWDGTNPDGTSGYEKVRFDGYDVHSYHAWNNPFVSPDSNHGGWVPFFNYIEQFAVRFGGRPIYISEFNADADSQSDADMAAWVKRINTDAYASRFDLNIAGVNYYAMFDADYKWGCVDSSGNLIATRGQALKKFIAQNPDVDNFTLTQKAFAVLTKYASSNVRLYLPSQWAFSDSGGTIVATDGAYVPLLGDVSTGGTTDATQSISAPTYQGSSKSIVFTGNKFDIAVPFMSSTDDFAVVVGAAPSGAPNPIATAQGVIALSTSNATSKYGRLGAIMFSSSGVSAEWYDDATTDLRATASLASYTTPGVYTSRKNGLIGSIRVNGAQASTVDLTNFVTSFTPTYGFLGAQFNSDPNKFNGNLYGAVAIKGKVLDADLLVLEQWMNSMTPTGVTF